MSPGESTASPSTAVITSPALTRFRCWSIVSDRRHQHAFAAVMPKVIGELLRQLHRAHADAASCCRE
jgi:hypothetical protein